MRARLNRWIDGGTIAQVVLKTILFSFVVSFLAGLPFYWHAFVASRFMDEDFWVTILSSTVGFGLVPLWAKRTNMQSTRRK